MYSLLAELSAHDLEVAETLIGVIRFLLIFLAARALAEVLVRLSLPTIVGELLAGVVIGASGFHLLIPPSAGTELNEGLVNVISSLASIPPEAVPDVYFESFPSLQAVATLGLFPEACARTRHMELLYVYMRVFMAGMSIFHLQGPKQHVHGFSLARATTNRLIQSHIASA